MYGVEALKHSNTLLEMLLNGGYYELEYKKYAILTLQIGQRREQAILEGSICVGCLCINDLNRVLDVVNQAITVEMMSGSKRWQKNTDNILAYTSHAPPRRGVAFSSTPLPPSMTAPSKDTGRLRPKTNEAHTISHHKPYTGDMMLNTKLHKAIRHGLHLGLVDIATHPLGLHRQCLRATPVRPCTSLLPPDLIETRVQPIWAYASSPADSDTMDEGGLHSTAAAAAVGTWNRSLNTRAFCIRKT
ncbi:hypothetical protein B0H14DRAFT_2608841 [Mycena olivaceomarginata]|nr:hypothetical protein B0H14DRAFT_2608841 [Mycena olivaceomarginata]